MHSLQRLSASLLGVLLFGASCLSVGGRAAGVHGPHATSDGPYYLALGDSITAGARKNAADIPGFAPLFFRTLQSRGVKAMLNLACPGESTASFITGPCPFPAYVPNGYHRYPRKSSQLQAALAFIHAHPGRVHYVTLLLGINDVVDPTTKPLGCTADAGSIRAAGDRLHAIVSSLQHALGTATRIILLNYYDPYPCPAHSASVVPALNATISRVEGESHIPVVGLYTAFGGSHTEKDRTLCHLTYVCSSGDIHPTPAGHILIAQVLAKLVEGLLR